jgi:hypothetical protein
MVESACPRVSCFMVGKHIYASGLVLLAYLNAEVCLKTRVSRHPRC